MALIRSITFLSLLFFGGIGLLPAQSIGFSEGKNLAQLQAAVYAPGNTQGIPPKAFKQVQLDQGTPAGLHPVFLPKWAPEDLPFFCKIEHDWGLKSRIPIKFRLGSVEYVDWLEGKE